MPHGTVVPTQINFNQQVRGSIEGKAAVVQYDKTPFIVLSDGGRQINPEELGLSLGRGDIVTIDREILTKQTEYGIKLTRC